MSLPDISTTALGMALIRAAERERTDRLFDDPLASAFLAAAPEAFEVESGAQADPDVLARVFDAVAFQGVVRTRFFDDWLLRATDAGCRQVVLLGAGLDARAFRLPWPKGVVVFEVDLPATLNFKHRVVTQHAMSPRCTWSLVRVDLQEDWPAMLVRAGFDRAAGAVFLGEGLLVYLSADDAAGLLSRIGQLASPGSELAFDHGKVLAPSLRAEAETMPGMERFSSLWRGGLGDDPVTWLAAHGWRAHSDELVTVGASYGRAAPSDVGGQLVTAVR